MPRVGLRKTLLMVGPAPERSVRYFAVVVAIGFLVVNGTPSMAQPPGGGPPDGPPGRRGGFRFPAPPVLTAIDVDGDGELSKAEIENASATLKKLDKNSDGELADDELMPEFGRGGPPGFGGRGGRGGFGGGRGGPGGFGEGGGATERVEPTDLEFKDGVAEIPDHATYHKLAYKGEQVMIDTFLAGLEFVKFTYDKPSTDEERFYFINTKTHRAHMMFGRVAGLPRGRGDSQMKGVLVYRPRLKSPAGNPGLYTFEFEPFDAYSHEMVKKAHDMLIQKMPALKGNIGYFPRGDGANGQVEKDKESYQTSGLPIYRDEDLLSSDVAFLPLNPGKSFGRLRLMQMDERPTSRDVVLYEALPNEMPRVAGIITSVRQTPLSHVNLRAVQDKVPNCFIDNATEKQSVQSLLGKFVAYSVTSDGYELRAATSEEVDSHFSNVRPPEKQFPKRDLAVEKIRPLSEVVFADAESVGVKAANIAAMGKFELPEGTVPDGFAVPFYFYDEFMKHNKLYARAKSMMAMASDAEDLADVLSKLRVYIENGTMPDWMTDQLEEVQSLFPKGQAIRCRSSTNNEDLPGFSGAGLYDSYTHKPDEGHLSKSIKQVYASLWNFRAVEERKFYRVDHNTTAMGVLLHENFKGELANGVAVTGDILYGTEGNYYINSQVGEDLVTNPNESSVPEEGLLDWWESSKYQLMRPSNRKDGGQVLSAEHLGQLRKGLGRIHGKFAKLYSKSLEDPKFAMEIEFKITNDGRLSIKQARPWVFAPEPTN